VQRLSAPTGGGVSRGEVRSSELRQEQLFGPERRSVEVSVRLTSYEVWRLDTIASGLHLSRSEALREAIGWLAARHGVWAERARKARVNAAVHEAESWDPISDHLAQRSIDVEAARLAVEDATDVDDAAAQAAAEDEDGADDADR
jgi:Arc/MetJ-type ribon-helix-helix transcriptional regulator